MAKTKKAPALKLTPLGRKLYAACYEYHVLSYLGPQVGYLSDELADDEHYARAQKRAEKAAHKRFRTLADKVASGPVTLASLGDRALLASLWTDDDADEDTVQLREAATKLAGLPAEWPWQKGWDVGSPPPEAEAVVRKLLGKHRPKRFALPPDEAERIAAKAGAEAVAKAKAAIKSDPGEAPLFAAAA